MGVQSRRTRSDARATIESMEPRQLLAAQPLVHAPISRGTLATKLGESLAGAYTQYQTITTRQTAASKNMSKAVRAAAASAIPALTAAAVSTQQVSLHVTGSGVQLIAYATSATTEKSLAASIKKLGGTGIQMLGQEVDAVVPVSQLSTLSKLKTLSRAVPDTYVVSAGTVTSQGDVADRASAERSVTGLNGTGIIVGIISDSFNNAATTTATNENQDISSGDLPANVSVITEDSLPATDEGRAIAQVIYDSAPGATIEFYSGVASQAALAAGISNLAQAGAKVIINDLRFADEPMFEDGLAAQAAAAAITSGVTYIAAAGNAGTDGYGANWSNGINRSAGSIGKTSNAAYSTVPVQFFGGETYNFGTPAAVNDMNQFTLGGQQTMLLSVQWNQPYGSITHTTGNTDQVDAYVLQTIGNTTTIVGGAARAVTPFVGGAGTYDPIQVISFTNPGAAGTTATYSLMLATETGTATPGYIKYVDLNDNAVFSTTVASPANGTIFGSANATGAIAVGSVGYTNTPAFGGTPTLETNSSVGTTPLFFDTSGNSLGGPVFRQEPLVDGPDQIATTFFGPTSTTTGLHVFSGTSAAAASVAGAAALLLQLSPSATAAQVAGAFETTALRIGSPIPNATAGYGFIQANAASSALVGTVTGTVYSDNNSNGVFDSGEPGVGGVTVYIDVNKNGAFDAGDLSTTTAGNGNYAFSNVPTGSAVVRLITPGAFIALSATATATVVGAATTASVNLGLFPTTFTTTTGGVNASVIVDPSVSTKIDITVGSNVYTITRTLLNTLGFILSGGNNTLTIDFSRGNPTTTSGITYTASGGNNTLIYNGTTGNDSASISGNLTSFNSTPSLSATGIASEIINGNNGNDVVSIANAPAAVFTFNGGVGNDTLNINSVQPNNGSGVVFNAGTNAADNNTLNISSGNYTFTTDPSLTSINLTVNVNNASSTAIFAAGALGSGFNQRKIAALNIVAGGTVTLPTTASRTDRTVLVTNTLALASTSKLDLTSNDLVVNSGSLTTVSNLVGTAYAGGAFTGNGITSSTARGDTAHLTSIGVVSNNQGGSPLFSSARLFDGVTPSLNAVLVKYTFLGDSNLDGKVDGSDYSNTDFGYATPGLTSWFNGNFNYDSVVDGTDYTLLDNTFNNQGPSL